MAQNTLLAAQSRLVSEGLLRRAGRKSLEITAERTRVSGAPLRVAFLLANDYVRTGVLLRELLSEAQTALENEGHICLHLVHPDISADSPGEDFAARVNEIAADAWLVFAGSQATLSWFLSRETPVLAVGGRCRDLPIAAVGEVAENAMREAIRSLLALGHRRIVFVSDRTWRTPTDGRVVKTFREELKAAGLPVGPFNLPDWEESPAGHLKLLRDLFQLTPPTAMIFSDYEPLISAISFAASRGIVIPRDLSMVVMGNDASLDWIVPAPARFDCSNRKILNNLLLWIDQVRKGQGDLREQRLVEARFVPGHSLARAPR